MITLVTVTFNAEATLERTLRSVECQTYTEIQHIIMDGASKDKTVAIANDYRDRVSARGIEVTVVSEPDKGLYDAMNKALEMAEGEYVCFLNAGDKLHSADTLQHVANAGNPDRVAVIYGNTDIVDGEGNRIGSRRLTPPEHLTWKSFRSGMLVCHQAFYINIELAPKYDLKYRFSADIDWCIRGLKQGDEMGFTNVYLHETVADYLSEGMTTANHRASLNERFRIMVKHYGLIVTVFEHLWFAVRAFFK